MLSSSARLGVSLNFPAIGGGRSRPSWTPRTREQTFFTATRTMYGGMPLAGCICGLRRWTASGHARGGHRLPKKNWPWMVIGTFKASWALFSEGTHVTRIMQGNAVRVGGKDADDPAPTGMTDWAEAQSTPRARARTQMSFSSCSFFPLTEWRSPDKYPPASLRDQTPCWWCRRR